MELWAHLLAVERVQLGHGVGRLVVVHYYSPNDYKDPGGHVRGPRDLRACEGVGRTPPHYSTCRLRGGDGAGADECLNDDDDEIHQLCLTPCFRRETPA